MGEGGGVLLTGYRAADLDKAVHSVEVELGIASDDEPAEANAEDEG